MEVVVEIRGQDRRSRSRAESEQTAFSEGTDLGIVEAETPEAAVSAALSAAVVEESSDERTEAADNVLDQADVDRS